MTFCSQRNNASTVPGTTREAIALGADALLLGNAEDDCGPNPDSRREVVQLLNLLREAKPQLVVTHAGGIDPHPAHQNVCLCVERAIGMLDTWEKPAQLLFTKPPANHEVGSFRQDLFISFPRGLALAKASLIKFHPPECKKRFYRPVDVLSRMAATATAADPFDRHHPLIEFAEAYQSGAIP